MSDGHKFVKLMRQAAKVPDNQQVDIITGTMSSINPPKIMIEDREIPSSFITMSPFCYPSSAWPGLQVGDNVLILRVSRGQTYYVLHKKIGGN